MQVGARAAGLLGDGEVAVHRLVLELRHQLGLDLVGAVVVKDAPVHVGSVMQVHAHAARAAGELFLDAQDLKLVEIPSAVLAGQVEAIQVVFLGQFVELLREGVGDLDLFLNLLERTFGKFADLLQIRFELLVGDLCIGIHVNLLRLCPPGRYLRRRDRLCRLSTPSIMRPRSREIQFSIPNDSGEIICKTNNGGYAGEVASEILDIPR